MFVDILPDVLRGSTTTISLLILLPILSRNKLKLKYQILIDLAIVLIDFLITTQFYLNHNYTYVVYYSLIFSVLIFVVFKFLLREPLFQWVFNIVTILNVYAMIVISSYFLSFLFSDPKYAVTPIRLVSFALVIIFFKKILRPLYLEVSENWGAFLLPITGILINYLYILLSLGDVETSMQQNIPHFYLLVVITVFSYVAIILSLKSLRLKFLLREDNIKRQLNEELLKHEIASYENSINAAKQTRHDIRHHNSILSEYLISGDIESAQNYLKFYDDQMIEKTFKEFSKHPIANAVFRIYDRHSREHNITFSVQAAADVLLTDRLPDFGIILSNILENALDACKQSSIGDRHIQYHSYVKNESILIEIRNSVEHEVSFENGLPITTKDGGGIGLLSVKSAVEKSHGMLDVKLENNEFLTRIILPLT